ncbi:MAG TPA: hypothetical protein VFN78_02580 [Ktedonobacterales bacterium]|nr:hypothetical protein [Ktedonobacterales bacterium]
MDYRDDDDRSDEFEGFGDLGEFGVTSAELPAVDVAQQVQAQRRVWQEQQARKVQEERLRQQCFARIQRGWREGRLSNPGYDLLQGEFECGLIPDLYRDEYGVFYVFSAHERRRYTLGSWERHAQDQLEPGDPERVTERITAPPIAPDPAVHRWRPWAENNRNVTYDGYTPAAAPVGSYGRPTPLLNPHMRPTRPPYRNNRRETGR